ncbi:hypothetical protein [Paraburkholderia youngii]|uniref:hypothetical protein n=1 Tax=Paraburkholderia youngii TaxID=2782701 RepID=UPI003D1DB110
MADFSARVASAFFLWPRELLDTELNRRTLALTVQHELFDCNPDGWNRYVSHTRMKVKWFGKGLPGSGKAAMDEPLHDAVKEIAPVGAAPSGERNAPGTRKGLALDRAGDALTLPSQRSSPD